MQLSSNNFMMAKSSGAPASYLIILCDTLRGAWSVNWVLSVKWEGGREIGGRKDKLINSFKTCIVFII